MVERATGTQCGARLAVRRRPPHDGPAAYYQNTPILGRMLAEWGENPTGVLMLLPLWHPVTAAEQLGTLASLAAGRFVLQCAIGSGTHQSAAMGVSERERVPRSSRVSTSSDGSSRATRSRRTTVRTTYEASAHRSRHAEATGGVKWRVGACGHRPRQPRLGDGWLADANLVPAEAGEQASAYREACARHRRDPGVVAIRRDVHVAASHGARARVAAPIVEAGYRGFRTAAITYGSIDEVAEAFRQYADMGYTDVIVRHLAEDQWEVIASLERLASVRTALSSR